VPAAHAAHEPELQVWLIVQAVLAQPQLVSVLDFSQAFAALVSQSIVPAPQAVHAPELQV
jgi:hypothetical protein